MLGFFLWQMIHSDRWEAEFCAKFPFPMNFECSFVQNNAIGCLREAILYKKIVFTDLYLKFCAKSLFLLIFSMNILQNQCKN
ncbi:hypothetical protein DF185_01075 [Marinifilum breve]|uniref:Uncharacterized protein n=1 Tax=Marinifilum breve TaxID=2184082 RepID=A0A2V4A203_9BACT|nr:hypothetical protein DF185_01075 [Marinifilum breve]